MMPINQRCPKCGNEFLGSDCLGDVCIACTLNVPCLFWICPDHPDGKVKWNNNVATCLECGKNNETP